MKKGTDTHEHTYARDRLEGRDTTERKLDTLETRAKLLVKEHSNAGGGVVEKEGEELGEEGEVTCVCMADAVVRPNPAQVISPLHY